MKNIAKILLIVLLVIVVLLIAFFIATNNPRKIIDKKVGFDIPASSKIINYSYNRIIGSFEAKILLNKEDVSGITQSLYGFYKSENTHDLSRLSLNYKPKWWDLNNSNIETAYLNLEGGPTFLIFTVMTVNNMAVISVQDDNNYYLYFDFVILPKDVLFLSN